MKSDCYPLHQIFFSQKHRFSAFDLKLLKNNYLVYGMSTYIYVIISKYGKKIKIIQPLFIYFDT